MATQTIVWTALPNGHRDDGRLCLSLFASPRLEPDADPTLAAFPDFVDWPRTLGHSRFTVRFGAASVSFEGNDLAGAVRIDARLGTPDSGIWTALLPKTTFVRGYAFRDLSEHAILSFHAAGMDDLVRNLYTRLAAAAGDQLPAISAILGDQEWNKLLAAVRANESQLVDDDGMREVEKQFREFKSQKEHGDSTLQQKLARFQLFHTPPSKPQVEKYAAPRDEAQASARWLSYKRTKMPTLDELAATIDFHQIVTAMNQYPTLLRKLGLVVDVLVPRDAFESSPDELLSVQVELPRTSNGTRPTDVSPRTRTLLDDGRFQSVSGGRPEPDLRIEDGLLDLNPNAFHVLQADVDGGGLKVTNFARSLLTLVAAPDTPDKQTDPVTQQEREIGAPALRNAGLMLVHDRRADMVTSSIKRQKEFAATAQQIRAGTADPASLKMFAEDLVRGYRIDVWDDVSKQWHSLCQRRAEYEIEREAPIPVPEEEGTVQLAATTSADPDSNADLIWLHEALVTWSGWSLCVPPPGKMIGHDPSDHSDPLAAAPTEVPAGLALNTIFRPLPGSLPRLRYGRTYRLRARAVDLAGNSLPPSRNDFPQQPAQHPTQYLRYEPIPPPAIALVRGIHDVEKPAEGESMERMAVRSFNDRPELNSVPSKERARRFAVPARTTQRDAEHHGLLDRVGLVDPSFFSMLVAKDHPLPEVKLSTPGPLDHSRVMTGYSVMEEGTALPYLPEPLAVEIAARLFDHPDFHSSTVINIPLYDGNEWPEALPFKIEIHEDAAHKPHFDRPTRTLVIPLPKAARVTLRLSVQPTAQALKLLGVWNWLAAEQQGQTLTIDGKEMTLEEHALRGQHWMLTPWRNVELVHAVQRPLITPELLRLDIGRGLKATFALPSFVTPCSIASTEHLDLRATWNDPTDDAAKDAPGHRKKTDHAFAVKMTLPRAYAGLSEYEVVEPDVIRAGGMFHDRIAPKVHEFHDTRYRRIEYWLEATTKFREFMPARVLTKTGSDPAEAIDDNIKVASKPVRAWIPSSAAPPAPAVLYAIPTFGWVRNQDEGSQSSWRRGGGLRVYLDRPWNASGYGEMLAVVLPGADFTGDPNVEPTDQPLKNFVTQWGNDPVWLSPFVAGAAPKPANFPLARTAPDPKGEWLRPGTPEEESDQRPDFKTTALRHPEWRTGGALVDIAPHDVFFDDDRHLWYCDIEVTWGASYFPFIRLALARYQPGSIEGVELSHVVLADFMQLVPDRWLNVTGTNDPRTRRVNVYGATFSDSKSHIEENDYILRDGSLGIGLLPPIAPSTVVEVTVERLDSSLGEDFGWQREPGAVVQRDAVSSTAASAVPISPALAKRAVDLLQRREFGALLDESLIEKVFAPPVLWQGTVTLPHADGSARYRLVITEYEEHRTDSATIPTPPGKGRRQVFVEHVPLGD